MADEQEQYGTEVEQSEENGQNYQQDDYTGQDDGSGFTSGGGDQQQIGGTGEDTGNSLDDDDDDRKLFVGGLSYETTEEELKTYFSTFGEIKDCVLKKEQMTGRPRGFGFVVFKDPSSVDKVLEKTDHKLRGRSIDPKKANPKKREPNLKVFVGGLSPDLPESDIREYFEKFGEIAEIDLPKDGESKRRGFCFIKFETEEVVRKVTEQRMQTLGGKEVEVKKSVPKRGGFQGGAWGAYGGGRGGMGGRGRGRGGYGGGGWNQGGYNQGGYGGYGNYNQGYGNYNQGGYGNYGGYDYNQGYNYNQGYGNGGWGSGYDQGYGGYDYSGWGGYGQDQSQTNSGYGKAPKRGGGHGYQPY